MSCKELGTTELIPPEPLPPGDVFTVGFDVDEGRITLFRIQCSVTLGVGRFSVVGVTFKGIREPACMAYDFRRTSG